MRRWLLFPILAVTLVLTACSQGTGANNGASPSGASDQAADVVTDPDDLMFLTMMIPHHEQAVAMSELAAERASDEQVKAIAQAIGGAQGKEISDMQTWLAQSGEQVSSDHAGHMTGMLSDEQLANLAALTGHDFDHEFLTLMVAHHEGAVAMAQDVLKAGTSAKVRALAGSIDEAQRAEIRQMKALIEELSQHDGH